jgi:[acyl-carrier-protein] S-malonyltransferase
MIVFVFPGQGAQVPGMGRAFHELSSAARAVFAEADEALGIQLTRLIFEGPASELSLTANTQPAVLTTSVAIAAACAERGLTPAMAGGHSVGEYAALVVAGALRFADAVRLVRKRGAFMQEAVAVGVGAMAAVMHLDVEVVQALCAEVAGDDVVAIAAINAPDQVVIAGHRTAVARAVARVSASGKKAVLLPVSAPFHCSLMSPVVPRLAAELDAIVIADPIVPVARNVDAELTRHASEVGPELLAQITRPVRWAGCVRRLVDEGATAFLEVGPGRVLTELNRKITQGPVTLPVATPGQLDAALARLKEVMPHVV